MPRKRYALLRYGVALVALVYGFAKLNGSQFTVLDSELDKPMGQVSGFWLTWYFFSYSKFYGNLVALLQLAGGVLLTVRKTALLGAFLLLPLFANIVLIDVFYSVDPGAMVVALLSTAALLVLIGLHKAELLALWRQQAERARDTSASAAVRGGAWVLRCAMIAFAAGFTYWIANYNNRSPTPLDGVWDVERVEPDRKAGGIPTRIFFERNRAFLCVFKFADQTYQWHHFEINPAARSIGIWREWLRKGPEVLRGSYALSEPHLTLEGRLGEEHAKLYLKRRSPR